MVSKNVIRLNKITSVLLEKEDNFLTLKENIQKLKTLFVEASQLREEDEQNRTDVLLQSGKAIGPTWAAMCVDDMVRTKKFLCGVDAAIQHKISEANQKPITIIYVGPGPFGTLVMPLISKYSSQEIQFVFLEVNPKTATYLKQTISFFEAENYVKEILICDASVVDIEAYNDTSIVIIECLQRALDAEPQVAITYNILRQLSDDVIMIPQDISLSVGLQNLKKDHENMSNLDYSPAENIEVLPPFLSLNKSEVINNSANTSGLSKEQTFMFTQQQLVEKDTVSILTKITLFNDIILNHNESGLTIPLILANLKDDPLIKGVTVSYELGETPRVNTQLIR